MNEMQSKAVQERLREQRVKQQVHKWRVELLEKETARKEKEARQQEQDDEDANFHEELMNSLHTDHNSEDDVSIASFNTIDTEREEEKVDEEKERADKMHAAMKSQRNEVVTFERYVMNVCRKKDIGWNASMIQTAKVLIEMENPRRVVPNARVLIENVITPSDDDFAVGSWAEFRGMNGKSA